MLRSLFPLSQYSPNRGCAVVSPYAQLSASLRFIPLRWVKWAMLPTPPVWECHIESWKLRGHNPAAPSLPRLGAASLAISIITQLLKNDPSRTDLWPVGLSQGINRNRIACATECRVVF